MQGVEKINIGNCVSRQNIKNVLGYAVKQRKGYYNQLKKVDERRGDTIEQFKTVGFINTGNTLKTQTFSITELGDEYYRDMFGKLSYWKQIISGNIERFLKRHI